MMVSLAAEVLLKSVILLLLLIGEAASSSKARCELSPPRDVEVTQL